MLSINKANILIFDYHKCNLIYDIKKSTNNLYIFEIMKLKILMKDLSFFDSKT